MTTRNRAFQPTTKATSDLVIGLMQLNIGAATDVSTAAAHGSLSSLGALKSSSLSMAPSFKEHKTGYPQILDFKIAELLQANFKAEVEEVMDATVLNVIDEAIDCLETGTPKYYSVEALAEFASGGTLSLFSPYAQLKPTLNFDFTDDFSAAPFEFEALSNPGYTNQDLIYRKRTNAASRSTDNQPMTKDVSNLAIGMFQVRVGKPSRRASGVSLIKAAQKRKNGALWDDLVNTNPVPTATGTYTGSRDGAFVVTVTDTAGPICSVMEPDGTVTNSVDLSTPTLLGDGVTLGFSAVAATNFAVGDVYVVGVYTANAISNDVTGIGSPYSFLTKSDSVGAIKSASLSTNPTFKEHMSGFPQVRDLLMLESSTVTISTAIEEMSAATTDLVKGYAVSLFDMLFDASVNGTLYNVPVEIVANLVTGNTISFWFPNCQVTPESEFAPGLDWANLPFSLEAQVQGINVSTKRLYRQTLVQNV